MTWENSTRAFKRCSTAAPGMPSAAKKPSRKATTESEPKASEKFYWQLAELPKGFRHELISALIVAQAKTIETQTERDLLLHLIASHHGYCRALAPVIPDNDPQQITTIVGEETITYPGTDCPLAHISDGVARRFWSQTRRFGWWGLAYLEALLRLADQRESAVPTIDDKEK